MKFNIITFGCKVNSYESEYIKEQLLNNGYVYSDNVKDSDIIIVNSVYIFRQSQQCRLNILNRSGTYVTIGP